MFGPIVQVNVQHSEESKTCSDQIIIIFLTQWIVLLITRNGSYL